MKKKAASMNPFSSAGEYLRDEEKNNVMLCKGGIQPADGPAVSLKDLGKEFEKWQAAGTLTMTNTVDNSVLMHTVGYNTWFKTGDVSNFRSEWVGSSGFDTVVGAEGGSKYNWEFQRKVVFYSDSSLSTEMASLTLDSCGETWYKWVADTSEAGGDGTETYDTNIHALRYGLVVNGKDVPLEMEGNLSTGITFKTSKLLVEWSMNWVTSGETCTITIGDSSTDELTDPVLTMIVGYMLSNENPSWVKHRVRDRIASS